MRRRLCAVYDPARMRATAEELLQTLRPKRLSLVFVFLQNASMRFSSFVTSIGLFM